VAEIHRLYAYRVGFIMAEATEETPSSTGGIKIAVTGKGGSGKTMLTAIMTGLLAKDANIKLLAIDADSAINLPYALGMDAKQTVAELRIQLIRDPKVRAEIKDKNIRIVMEEALESGTGFSLLVMGRPEGPGCYCAINDLLKYGIDRLSKQFDITLIDCEAGPEQINRRVVNGVDVLVIVTDSSTRGVRVAGSILKVIQSDESMKNTKTGLVINRWQAKTDDRLIEENAKRWGVDILGRIPDDDCITEYDSAGKPLIDLPNTSPSVMAVKEILRRITPS
ncbi:MAG: AAA family ATPase, partial [Dehalococcoidia bacterium]